MDAHEHIQGLQDRLEQALTLLETEGLTIPPCPHCKQLAREKNKLQRRFDNLVVVLRSRNSKNAALKNQVIGLQRALEKRSGTKFFEIVDGGKGEPLPSLRGDLLEMLEIAEVLDVLNDVDGGGADAS